MIYTLTLNPAIDYVMGLDEVDWGGINRARWAELRFGGKGINVSTVLNALGVETVALGFTAGFTGEALERAVSARGLAAEFIRLPRGLTRVNVKLKSGVETELNAQGPVVTPEDMAKLYEKLERLRPGDTLVLAGSAPEPLPRSVYGDILARLEGRGVRTVVDAAGELLARALERRPFLVKPNRAELEELLGRRLDTDGEVARGAEELRARGAENVLVSLGADGALLADGSGRIRRRRALPGRAVDTVGAGDSMVAGFLAGLAAGREAALDLAVAAGCATAFAPGLAGGEEIARLLRLIRPDGGPA